MLVKADVFSSYQRVHQIGRNLLILYRRPVLVIVLADQLAIGRVHLAGDGDDGISNILHIRRIAKQPQEVQLYCAEKQDNKIYEYGEIPQVLITDAFEHWVNMENYAAIT